MTSEAMRGMKVAFLHPDLGVGGAERLVVDAGLGLRERGHDVHYFTYYHSPTHCFPETTNGQLPVTVWFSFLPHHIFRKGHALLANLKMAILTLRFILSGAVKAYDVVVVDQVAMPLLFLSAFNYPNLFYCHFPDKLCDATLAQPSRSLLRTLYRFLFDTVEEWCLELAQTIIYNSEFTKATTLETFTSLQRFPHDKDAGEEEPDDVIYPPVGDDVATPARTDLTVTAQTVDGVVEVQLTESVTARRTLLSLNRFERKKNVELAIRTLAILHGQGQRDLQLIVAGGWDEKVSENVEYLEELKRLADKSFVKKAVLFMPSISDEVKRLLLQRAAVMLYTPPAEHFGIAPVEAMRCGTPVVAVNHGGPKESIQHERTGYLTEATPLAFAKGVTFCLANREELGATGERWAAEVFGRAEFALALERKLLEVVDGQPLPSVVLFACCYFCVLMVLSAGISTGAIVAIALGWSWASRVFIALIPITGILTAWLFIRSLHVR